MNAKPKKRDPFNPSNRDFRAILSLLKTKEAIACMNFIGCKSRPIFVEMAIHDFVRKNTPQCNQEK